MNKLTISFETASGVHSFTVLDAPRDLYDAAVSGVDASRSDVPTRRGNGRYVQADVWQSICASVGQVYGARPRADIDVAGEVRDMVNRLSIAAAAAPPCEWGTGISLSPSQWGRITNMSGVMSVATVDQIIDALASRMPNHD